MKNGTLVPCNIGDEVIFEGNSYHVFGISFPNNTVYLVNPFEQITIPFSLLPIKNEWYFPLQIGDKFTFEGENCYIDRFYIKYLDCATLFLRKENSKSKKYFKIIDSSCYLFGKHKF